MFPCSSGTGLLPLSFQPGTVLTPSQPLVYIPASKLWAAAQRGYTASHPGSLSTLAAPCPAILLAGQVSRVLASPELRSYRMHSLCDLTSESQAGVSGGEQAPLRLPIRQHQHPACTHDGVPGPLADTSLSTASAKVLPPPQPLLPAPSGSSATSPPRCQAVWSSKQKGLQLPSLPSSHLHSWARNGLSTWWRMPLDLSSKSNRQKLPLPEPAQDAAHACVDPCAHQQQALLSTVLSRSDARPKLLAAVSPHAWAPPHPLSSSLRCVRSRGPGTWVKNSTALISTIPGTLWAWPIRCPPPSLLNKDPNLGLTETPAISPSRHLHH